MAPLPYYDRDRSDDRDYYRPPTRMGTPEFERYSRRMGRGVERPWNAAPSSNGNGGNSGSGAIGMARTDSRGKEREKDTKDGKDRDLGSGVFAGGGSGGRSPKPAGTGANIVIQKERDRPGREKEREREDNLLQRVTVRSDGSASNDRDDDAFRKDRGKSTPLSSMSSLSNTPASSPRHSDLNPAALPPSLLSPKEKEEKGKERSYGPVPSAASASWPASSISVRDTDEGPSASPSALKRRRPTTPERQDHAVPSASAVLSSVSTPFSSALRHEIVQKDDAREPDDADRRRWTNILTGGDVKRAKLEGSDDDRDRCPDHEPHRPEIGIDGNLKNENDGHYEEFASVRSVDGMSGRLEDESEEGELVEHDRNEGDMQRGGDDVEERAGDWDREYEREDDRVVTQKVIDERQVPQERSNNESVVAATAITVNLDEIAERNESPEEKETTGTKWNIKNNIKQRAIETNVSGDERASEPERRNDATGDFSRHINYENDDIERGFAQVATFEKQLDLISARKDVALDSASDHDSIITPKTAGSQVETDELPKEEVKDTTVVGEDPLAVASNAQDGNYSHKMKGMHQERQDVLISSTLNDVVVIPNARDTEAGGLSDVHVRVKQFLSETGGSVSSAGNAILPSSPTKEQPPLPRTADSPVMVSAMTHSKQQSSPALLSSTLMTSSTVRRASLSPPSTTAMTSLSPTSLVAARRERAQTSPSPPPPRESHSLWEDSAHLRSSFPQTVEVVPSAVSQQDIFERIDRIDSDIVRYEGMLERARVRKRTNEIMAARSRISLHVDENAMEQATVRGRIDSDVDMGDTMASVRVEVMADEGLVDVVMNDDGKDEAVDEEEDEVDTSVEENGATLARGRDKSDNDAVVPSISPLFSTSRKSLRAEIEAAGPDDNSDEDEDEPWKRIYEENRELARKNGRMNLSNGFRKQLKSRIRMVRRFESDAETFDGDEELEDSYDQNGDEDLANGDASEDRDSSPVYEKFEDYPFYEKNVETHQRLRPILLSYLHTNQQSLSEKEMDLKRQYKAHWEAWKKRCEKLDKVKERKNAERLASKSNGGRKRTDDADADGLFDPLGLTGSDTYFNDTSVIDGTLGSPLYSSSTRSGNRRGGSGPGSGYFTSDAVRSEAELLDIIRSLENADLRNPDTRAAKTTANIPPMILDPYERETVRFDDRNHLIEKPLEYYRCQTETDTWTDEERAIFIKKYVSYPKQFGKIASFIEHKNATQCVLFYYRFKKKINFKDLLAGRTRGRKGRKKDRVAAAVAAATSVGLANSPSSATRKAKNRGSALLDDIGQAQNSRRAQKEKEIEKEIERDRDGDMDLDEKERARNGERDRDKKSKELRELEEANAYWDGVHERKKSKVAAEKAEKEKVVCAAASATGSTVGTPAPEDYLEVPIPERKKSGKSSVRLKGRSPRAGAGYTSSSSSVPTLSTALAGDQDKEMAEDEDNGSIPPESVDNAVTGDDDDEDDATSVDMSGMVTPKDSTPGPTAGTSNSTAKWSAEDRVMAVEAYKRHGRDFEMVARIVGTKTEDQCRNFYHNYKRKYGNNALDDDLAGPFASESGQQDGQMFEDERGTDKRSSRKPRGGFGGGGSIEKSDRATAGKEKDRPKRKSSRPTKQPKMAEMIQDEEEEFVEESGVSGATAADFGNSETSSTLAMTSSTTAVITRVGAAEEDAAAALVGMFQGSLMDDGAVRGDRKEGAAEETTSATLEYYDIPMPIRKKRVRTASARGDVTTGAPSSSTTGIGELDAAESAPGRRQSRGLAAAVPVPGLGDSSSKRPAFSSYWSVSEKSDFLKYLAVHGKSWDALAAVMKSKTAIQVRNYYQNNLDKLDLERIVNEHESRRMETDDQEAPIDGDRVHVLAESSNSNIRSNEFTSHQYHRGSIVGAEGDPDTDVGSSEEEEARGRISTSRDTTRINAPPMGTTFDSAYGIRQRRSSSASVVALATTGQQHLQASQHFQSLQHFPLSAPIGTENSSQHRASTSPNSGPSYGFHPHVGPRSGYFPPPTERAQPHHTMVPSSIAGTAPNHANPLGPSNAQVAPITVSHSSRPSSPMYGAQPQYQQQAVPSQQPSPSPFTRHDSTPSAARTRSAPRGTSIGDLLNAATEEEDNLNDRWKKNAIMDWFGGSNEETDESDAQRGNADEYYRQHHTDESLHAPYRRHDTDVEDGSGRRLVPTVATTDHYRQVQSVPPTDNHRHLHQHQHRHHHGYPAPLQTRAHQMQHPGILQQQGHQHSSPHQPLHHLHQHPHHTHPHVDIAPTAQHHPYYVTSNQQQSHVQPSPQEIHSAQGLYPPYLHSPYPAGSTQYSTSQPRYATYAGNSTPGMYPISVTPSPILRPTSPLSSPHHHSISGVQSSSSYTRPASPYQQLPSMSMVVPTPSASYSPLLPHASPAIGYSPHLVHANSQMSHLGSTHSHPSSQTQNPSLVPTPPPMMSHRSSGGAGQGSSNGTPVLVKAEVGHSPAVSPHMQHVHQHQH
ncbi:hypothetical protein BC936DRAFT_149967 [Jimgerdemannia flammicorona]|uniref:SANT domain-containing protein n=1 Tax=Jimgerdemannia flammicorona TaxID=994334 RepID=A0A433CZT9_9FUNG|nr:hypothetical protein BC936DRAFT_149967 [Jimgerdemannia flammicorona]